MDGRSGTMGWLLCILAVAVAVSVGCSPDTGGTDTGDQEPQQEEEQPQTLEIELVNQWLESGHSKLVGFAAAEEGCKNCHDGATYWETGGGFQARMETGTAGATEGTETAERDWVVSTDCRVCHSGAGVTIAEQGSVDIPGQEVEGGLGSLCISCHNGWHGPGKSQEGAQRAPHSSVQGDMVFSSNVATVGTNALETQNPHQDVENVCVGCHVAGGENGEPPSHAFKPEPGEACAGDDCHDGDPLEKAVEEDLDGDQQTEPYQEEVDGLLERLKTAIESKAGGTFESAEGNIKFASRAKPDEATYAAAYNYLFVMDDSSRGVHNPPFTTSLLKESIASIETTQQ